VPVFGQVDQASADEKKVETMEIFSTEGFQLPLDDPDLSSLKCHVYDSAAEKGDRLVITYNDGSSVEFFCTDGEEWIFKANEQEIMLMVDEWVDLPDEPVNGESYQATVFVYTVPNDLGIKRGDYLENISVTVGGAARNVENFKVDSPKGLVLPESKDGTYKEIDINNNKGDKLTVEFTDDTTSTYTADEDGTFYNDLDGSEWTALYFVWTDGTEELDSDTIVRDAGKTYNAYMYLKKGLNSGDEVYATDKNGNKVMVPITIADHTFGANEITKATPTADGSITHTCTVCNTKETETIAKASGYKLSATSYTYNGKAKKPAVTVTDANGKVIAAANYNVAYSGNVKAGKKAAVKVTFKGDRYSGSKTINFTIKKAAQSITKVTPASKTYKANKKTKKLAKTYTFTLKAKSKGAVKVKFSKANKKGGSKITVSKSGKVSVKKGLKKGTYKVKVKATKASNANYNAAKAKTVTVKIVVK